MKIYKTVLAVSSFAASLLTAFSSSAQAPTCNEDCLISMARQYMEVATTEEPSTRAARDFYSDVVKRDFSGLPWADRVRFTENNVAMMIGEGFWGAARGEQTELFVVADETTGNVLWYGITEEHEQAAYHGLRLKVVDNKISEVETYFGREGTPDLFAPTADYRFDNSLSQNIPGRVRVPRERMIAIVDGYFNTRQLNDGTLFTDFSDDCTRITNGVNVTFGDYWAADIAEGCEAQLAEGIYRPVDRIRARRYPIVNEETGIVVALSIEDHAARYVNYESVSGEPLSIDVEYPNSRGMLEIFRIRDGEIARIEGVSVFLPYYIHDLWNK